MGGESNYISWYIIYIKRESTVHVGQFETEESKDGCKNKRYPSCQGERWVTRTLQRQENANMGARGDF